MCWCGVTSDYLTATRANVPSTSMSPPVCHQHVHTLCLSILSTHSTPLTPGCQGLVSQGAGSAEAERLRGRGRVGSGGCEWVHVYSDCVGKCLYVSERGECVCKRCIDKYLSAAPVMGACRCAAVRACALHCIVA